MTKTISNQPISASGPYPDGDPNGYASLTGSGYGPAFDGMPENAELHLTTDDGAGFRVIRQGGELGIIVKHTMHDPDLRLRMRDWSFDSLYNEVAGTPGARDIPLGPFKAVIDRESRLFLFTTPVVSFHPAVAAVVFPSQPEGFPDLLSMLMIVVAGRWRFPAVEPANENAAAHRAA
jgi:hypothetical protein